MKKITSIFALLLCVFVFSCSNDDDKETSSLQIVSSNVTFESAGGTGTIKVNAISEITATSNKDWCTVSVNGDIINVSVIENNDMSGRTAAVTITDGEASTLVPVSQGGCLCEGGLCRCLPFRPHGTIRSGCWRGFAHFLFGVFW